MMLISALLILASYQMVVTFDFPTANFELKTKDRDYLDGISTDEWLNFLKLGSDSIDTHKRLEENLLNSQITITNGSISHEQLLDSLPDAETKEDSDIAIKILNSAMYVYNSKCAEREISEQSCAAYLATKQLPAGSDLQQKCTKLVQSSLEHHAFRRLLPRNYRDGLHEMFDGKLPEPRYISRRGLAFADTLADNKQLLDENERSLVFVQWTQFVEHDLSKPVVTSMSDGSPIECCLRDNFKLLPRFKHPACAPLLATNPVDIHARQTCLNYVRSALTVGSSCTFGAPEQRNQVTGYFDLSQLYGITDQAQRMMRTLKSGKIKSTRDTLLQRELLPMVTDGHAHQFCAQAFGRSNDSVCFMAGDSRVNSNPLSIVIYTIFMRNHNRVARSLEIKHPTWTDEQLYKLAKAININIYRRIVMTEWLPEVVGNALFQKINAESLQTSAAQSKDPFAISNEFAVAAIRFYISMMPNELRDVSASEENEQNAASAPELKNNNILPEDNIFVLKDERYKPQLDYTAIKLNNILDSLLQQRVMKMNSVDNKVQLILNYQRPTHADIFAFDIQRGRDHGLQGYVKYLEICRDVKIKSWQDLEAFISKEDLQKLIEVYKHWSDIDLIVGGIAEIPRNSSAVGPTFACILAEQFTKIHRYQNSLKPTDGESTELPQHTTVTAAELLCDNSEIKYVPTNIFKLGSTRNPLVSCIERRKAFHL